MAGRWAGERQAARQDAIEVWGVLVRRVGQVRRRDANEPGIVKALEAAGAHVTRISGKGAPDLLVRYQGRLWAFEVKNVDGRNRATASQTATDWPVVRSTNEALAAIGITVHG